ncbi:MAG: hypothetical protein JXK93_01460 [Sphaerochaetaceae bacterium]|nr:hypothetical protein [Sphaerochaetaceae bacterium]
MTTHNSLEMRTLLDQTGHLFSQKDIPRLEQQISTHMYLVNQKIPWVITRDDAIFSWQENVFTPIMDAISSWTIRKACKNLSEAELFFAVSDHWYYLLEQDKRISAYDAAADYAATFGTGLFRLVHTAVNRRRVA